MAQKNVGGQAVIEGVMMRGLKGVATSVRKENGDIVTKMDNSIPFAKKYPKLDKPFLRGIFVLIDNLKIGINSLNYSASFFEEEEETKFDKWLNKKFGNKANDIIISITMVISFIFSIAIFVGIPTGVASIFQKFNFNSIGLNIIEAILRIAILVFYMWIISKLDDIYRLFQYHGAEHKTIFCYEAGEELTVENVKKFSRFHPRCGTNFLFLVMFISIFIFTFTSWGSFLYRLVLRIVLIPLISGISYELIRWLGKNNGELAKIIAYPGLKLQNLTTREPDESQIEVAITSLKKAEGIEEKATIGKLIDLGVKKLSNIDSGRLDSQLLLSKVLEKDKVYILTNSDKEVSEEKTNEYLKLIDLRSNNKPLKYILGECDFMGLDFNLEEGVLIPRSDTEVLVQEVLNNISENSSINVCDLCCGSGAIGIALAHYRKNIKVDSVDYFDIPEKVTKSNIIKNNLVDRVNFIKSDLLKEIIKNNKKYEIIVSNPPYIESDEIHNLMKDVKDYEPLVALDGGKDGLEFYRKIVDESKAVLVNDGLLAFEIGYNQGNKVKEIMEENGFYQVEIKKDLAGLDRVVIGKFIC